MFSSGSPVRMSVMQQSSSSFSYGERPQMGLDVEFGADPASGGFFNTDYKKHDDLKQMLDSNKDGLKLEAMKRIISMLARGRNASDLFPSVVKNVVSKNIEVKKLVYVYLVRYAEEQQDLVLLSISTFQRGLKDPNQLIRASALRVLSSIRVQMIVPIVMLAIRDSSSDMSPYVRKTAAHAIPKLYSLDPEQKDELVVIIEKLLSDRTTLVVGSAVMAFEEVCPERVDLIHKNFRKLCNLLVDVDEWGQVIIINMLTRYARTQFTNPNAGDNKDGIEENSEKFYDNNDGDEHSSDDDKKKKRRSSSKQSICSLNLDHRLLLRQAKPLLQSRNASVVMAVAQLYHHVAPHIEVNIIAQSLIRLLRGHKEVQSIVLTCIASMSTKRKSIFEPYLKSFFVRTSDSTHIMLLKLEILTNLASVTNTAMLLREFQTYINSSDRVFVAATIQAIGRCAASIKEVTDTCLSGLVHLLSNKDEHIVAESVVVIKMLLQTKAAEHFEIISQMAGLLDFITVPAARASILWLIGEYNEKVPKIAPDVLRKCAKTFCDEEDVVKLQALNLSMKLYLINPEQTSLLCQYVFTLARYDSNYDVRDRARFLRQFIFPADELTNIFSKNAQSIFLSKKPAPALEGKYQGRDHFQLGSLSHYLNMRANGYRDLSDFPRIASDSSLRNTVPFEDELHAQQNASSEIVNDAVKQGKYSNAKKEHYSETSNSDESSTSDESSGEEDDTTVEKTVSAKYKNSDDRDSDSGDHSTSTSSNSDSSSDDSSSSDKSTSESESESETEKTEKVNNSEPIEPKPPSDLDLLLDLTDIPAVGTVMTPSQGGFLPPAEGLNSVAAVSRIELVGPSYINHKHAALLNKLSGNGLSVNFRFTRSSHIYSSSMVSIELYFTNHSNEEMTNIKLAPQKFLPSGMNVNEFDPIPSLQPQKSVTRVLGLDCNDSTQVIDLEIQSNKGNSKISLKAPIGELIRSIHIDEDYYREERQKLRGMNEHQCKVPRQSTDDINCLKTKIFQKLNLANIKCSQPDFIYFAGQTLASKSLVLVSLELLESEILVLVNCEKMVIASMVLTEIRSAITGL